jgi:2-iminobutanoate/2-iminopropanoate deaminase
MKKKIVECKLAPKAIGPYSQAVEFDGYLHTSGVIPLNIETGEIIAEDIETQARTVLNYMSNILQSCGYGLENVIKTTVFMTDLKEFIPMNRIYEEFFRENPPARSTIEVSALPKGAKIEIEAIARK